MTQVVVHVPELVLGHPTTLHEWYHFDQGTLVNYINDVTRKNWGAIWVSVFFQYCMPQLKSNLDNISSSNLHRIIILVSTHMFLWSKNRMKPLIERSGHSYVANLGKSKMAASKNNFMTKCLDWKPNQSNQWYRDKDRCGYKRFVFCVSELLFDIESQSWCLWVSCFWVNEWTVTS